MSDLKPCHWCGEADPLLTMDGYSSAYAVACPDCGARGPKAGFIFNVKAAKESAIAHWNDLPRREDMLAENARRCDLLLQGGAIHVTMKAEPSSAAPSHTLALADHVQAIRDALAADENLMVDAENAGREFRLVRKVTQIEVVV